MKQIILLKKEFKNIRSQERNKGYTQASFLYLQKWRRVD